VATPGLPGAVPESPHATPPRVSITRKIIFTFDFTLVLRRQTLFGHARYPTCALHSCNPAEVQRKQAVWQRHSFGLCVGRIFQERTMFSTPLTAIVAASLFAVAASAVNGSGTVTFGSSVEHITVNVSG